MRMYMSEGEQDELHHAPGTDGDEEPEVAEARRTWPRKPSDGDSVSSFGTKCRAAILFLSQVVMATVPSADKFYQFRFAVRPGKGVGGSLRSLM